MQITVIHDTWAKQDVVPAAQLKDSHKSFIKNGTVLEVTKNDPAPARHRRVTLQDKLGDYNTWLLFSDHLKYVGADLISGDQAEAIFGRRCTPSQLKDLNDCLNRFEINTSFRIRFFMSQLGAESSGMQFLKELDPGWYIPDRFDLPAIASSDGGYKYRGGGGIQLSMPENYLAFSKFMGDPEIYNQGCPYVAAKYPMTSAGFWWSNNGMNNLCDSGADIWAVSRAVNLGNPWSSVTPNGMDDRLHYYNKACKVI